MKTMSRCSCWPRGSIGEYRRLVYIYFLSMAGKKSILFRLVSSAGTGYFYIGSKPNTYPPVNWVPSSKSWPWGNTIPWSMSTSSSTRWRCRRVRNARDSLRHIPYTLHKQHPSTHIKPNSKEHNVVYLAHEKWKKLIIVSINPFSFVLLCASSLQLDRLRPFDSINSSTLSARSMKVARGFAIPL